MKKKIGDAGIHLEEFCGSTLIDNKPRCIDEYFVEHYRQLVYFDLDRTFKINRLPIYHYIETEPWLENIFPKTTNLE